MIIDLIAALILKELICCGVSIIVLFVLFVLSASKKKDNGKHLRN